MRTILNKTLINSEYENCEFINCHFKRKNQIWTVKFDNCVFVDCKFDIDRIKFVKSFSPINCYFNCQRVTIKDVTEKIDFSQYKITRVRVIKSLGVITNLGQIKTLDTTADCLDGDPVEMINRSQVKSLHLHGFTDFRGFTGLTYLKICESNGSDLSDLRIPRLELHNCTVNLSSLWSGIRELYLSQCKCTNTLQLKNLKKLKITLGEIDPQTLIADVVTLRNSHQNFRIYANVVRLFDPNQKNHIVSRDIHYQYSR